MYLPFTYLSFLFTFLTLLYSIRKLLREGLLYVQRDSVDIFDVELVADRVLGRIDDYWDNVLRKEATGSDINTMPERTLSQNIKEKPLSLADAEKSLSSKSSEGRLIIDESKNSDEDIFEDDD